MPQGKTKLKVNLPPRVVPKKSFKSKTISISHQARPNAPVPRKFKGKAAETQKLEKAIRKTLSDNLEEELRAKAMDGKKSLLSKIEIARRAEKK